MNQSPATSTCRCAGPYVMSSLDELLGCIINLSNNISLVQVPMVSLVISCHVNVDNVSILKRPLIWNTMTDDLRSSTSAESHGIAKLAMK